MTAPLPATLAPGVDVTLHAQRALFWPDEATLFVADLHLGKADLFQLRGIPVPSTLNNVDLDRLSALLRTTAAERLVILGDLIHASGGHSTALHDALAAWRSAHASLDLLLIQGNHDRHAGPPPASFNATDCGTRAQIGPFTCVHEPPDDPDLHADGLTLCGHLHPMARLSDGPHGVRLHCFSLRAQVLVLPAFGIFTGGATIYPRQGDRVWVVAGESVVEVTPAPRSGG